MSMQRKRAHRTRQKTIPTRGLIWAGFVFLLAAGLWIVYSIRQSGTGGTQRISRLTTNDFHSLAFSPTEPETVFFGHHDGLMVSYDGGKDWQRTTLSSADAMALAIPPSKPQTMYAAGHNVFVKSGDGGTTWEPVPANLPGFDIHAFTVDPENADKVFAYVVSFGLFGSSDGGVNWEFVSASAPSSVHGLAVGGDDQILYAAAAGAGLWQSRDDGKTWEPLSGTPDHGAIAVLYDRYGGRLYVTTLGSTPGLYVSEDQGASWTLAGLRGLFLAIAVSPLDPNRVMAVNDQGEVFASRDGGISWSDE